MHLIPDVEAGKGMGFTSQGSRARSRAFTDPGNGVPALLPILPADSTGLMFFLGDPYFGFQRRERTDLLIYIEKQ